MKTANIEIINEYCDYLLGDQARGLEAKDQSDVVVVARPLWSQVLHYEFQITKEMSKRILKGDDFGEALRRAWADPVLRERHFVTPLAVSAISSVSRGRSRSPKGRGQQSSGSGGTPSKGRGKSSRPNGKGKGKGNSKGQGRTSNKGWFSKTPDGRASATHTTTRPRSATAHAGGSTCAGSAAASTR